MALAKNAKSKNCCHDCGKTIEIEGKEIKNGVMAIYDKKGEKLMVFKCQDCFQKNQELRNYQPCEVYSRVVGYLRPVQQWNLGKKEEFRWRREYRKFNEKKLTTLPCERIPK